MNCPLKVVPTRKGKDRDEWPMAMCAEGGAGADIRYISPSDNRGAGSWVGHKLDDYPGSTKIEFIVKLKRLWWLMPTEFFSFSK